MSINLLILLKRGKEVTNVPRIIITIYHHDTHWNVKAGNNVQNI